MRSRKPVFKRSLPEGSPGASQKRKRLKALSCTSVLHRQSAEIVEKVLRFDEQRRGGATIKSLTLADGVESKKATHAVVCETLRYLHVVKELIARSGGQQVLEQIKPSAAYVLVYEMLFGQGLKHVGEAEEKILGIQGDLEKAMAGLLAEKRVKGVQALVLHRADRRPRYARVNILKLSVQSSLDRFQREGYRLEVDKLLSDVLEFSPDTELHDHPLVKDGSVVLQGYGSSMVAHALSPKRHWNVLDACASPGNKTTHLAALMHGTGRVMALDIHKDRFKRLQLNVQRAGASNVVCHQMDFLDTDPESKEFREMDAVLLDPSCSGSGTVFTRQDDLLPSARAQRDGNPLSTADTERIKRLAAFQVKALMHAFRFPKAKRVSYSTCSVLEEENERVVEAVLPFAKQQGFKLKTVLPRWSRRGRPLFKDCQKLLRVDPQDDATDGFFLALFTRRASEKP